VCRQVLEGPSIDRKDLRLLARLKRKAGDYGVM